MNNIKLLLYCTKSKPYLYDLRNLMGEFNQYNAKQINFDFLLLNGKIVAECDFEVEEIRVSSLWFDEDYITKTFREKEILKYSCLTYEELDNYLQGKNGYAIHIKNLHIFDEPKELDDYYTKVNDTDRAKDFFGLDVKVEPIRLDEWFRKYETFKPLKKAPQNMQKIIIYNEETHEYEYAILISIQSPWMHLILNRIKDVEVRRVILKEMLG